MNKKQSKNKFNVVNDCEKNLMEKWQNASNEEILNKLIQLENKKNDKYAVFDINDGHKLRILKDWYGGYLLDKDLKEQEELQKQNKKGDK